MLAQERQAEILRHVAVHGAASTVELMDLLGASSATVRRDLDKLSRAGKVTRVHGGVVAAGKGPASGSQDMAERRVQNVDAKRTMAEYAARLVRPGDLVFIDAGAATESLVDLVEEADACYVTNSLPHARRLGSRGLRVLMPAGEVNPATMTLVGEETIRTLARYHFTIGFWGTDGIGIESGLTTPDLAEAAVKEATIRQTRRPYVLCDRSKFFHESLVTFAAFDDVSVICDGTPGGPYDGKPNITIVRSQA